MRRLESIAKVSGRRTFVRQRFINQEAHSTLMKAQTFCQRVFFVAGLYGLVVLFPQYFMEASLNRRFPPPVTHPEHFYGFIGVAIAWQFAFLLIARDPQRFRPFMLAGVLEKLSFGVAAIVLYAQGRVALFVLCAGSVDLLLAIFFILAFRASGNIGDSKTGTATGQA
jgi:hypothetical protein